MNRTTALLGLALVLSLGLNALQWLTAPSDEAVEAARRQAGGGGGSAGTGPTEESEAPTPAEAAAETGCWVELADCRGDHLEASREDAEENARAFTHHDPLGEEESGHVGAAGLAPRASQDVDSDFQEDVLETIALGQLRDAWEEDRDATVAALLQTVSDEDQREEARQHDLTRAYTLLEVPDEEREAFEAGYGEVWVSRVEEFRAALAQAPPDASAALDAAKALYRDQDSYVDDHLGDDARRRLRISQAEHRTTVLALLATFADVPWDDRITW